MNILAALARDPNVSADFRRQFGGFVYGSVGDPGSERAREVRDEGRADQMRAERAERVERGE